MGHCAAPLNVPCVRVRKLVLDLHQDDRTALVRKELPCRHPVDDDVEPLLHRGLPHAIRLTKLDAGLQSEPRREASVRPLRADVRSDAKVHKETRGGGLLHEEREIAAALPVVDAFLFLMEVPEDVNLQHVEVVFAGECDPILPIVRRASRRVNGARDEESVLAVQHQRALVVRDVVRRALHVREERVRWRGGSNGRRR